MKNFDKRNDVLALDFDGVISNSINECLVSGHNAYAELTRSSKVESIQRLNKKWIQHAIEIRNYIRNGEDYVYIALALDKGVSISNQAEFDEFKQHNIDRQNKYFDVFFSERLNFAESDLSHWAALSPLYDGIAELLKNVNVGNLYIVTTKKLVFVEKILAANNINLQQQNLHDTSNGFTKREIIENILKQRNKKPEQCYFIDDQIDTLIKTKPSGVQVILAAWGYNNIMQHEKAKKNDIPIFTLEQFTNFFGEDV